MGHPGMKGDKGDPGASTARRAAAAGSAEEPVIAADEELPRFPRSRGECYRHWGGTSCLPGFQATVTGRTGGLESYTSSPGTLFGNVECVSGAAPVLQTFPTTYNNRLTRGEIDADGFQFVDNSCAICCSRGCYTALGTDTCAPGYYLAYAGRAGGVEGYAGAQLQGDTLCVDVNATVSATYSSGYNTRIMRHRPVPAGGGANGMDVVSNACAVCCKP
jgi:hypothetical protein